MKPKSDASRYYKTLSIVEKQREDKQKIQEAQKAIREMLGIKEVRSDGVMRDMQSETEVER